MGSPSYVDLRIKGSFTVKERPEIVLENVDCQVQIHGKMLVLTDEESFLYPFSDKFTLVPSVKDPSHSLMVLNNSYGWTEYLGEMEFQIEEEGIQMINHIDVETYLYGVVPYEMGNGWPLEALKAQAVASRTYAVKSIRSTSYFDLYDTEYSQVYRGYNPDKANAIKAVKETSGQVLKYQNDFATTYYSASNGGRTESTENLWGTFIPYLVSKEDPFDVSNPNNSAASWKVVYSKLAVDPALQLRLKVKMAPDLEKNGYSGSVEDIIIRQIKELSFDPPNSSGRVDKGRIVVIADVKNRSTGETATVEQTIDLTKGNARSILNVKSLKFTVQDEGDRYVIQGSGYGHGVGMSQAGAQQMALQSYNYAEILNFYYPGTQLVTLWNPEPDDSGSSRGDTRPEPGEGEAQQPEEPGDNTEPPTEDQDKELPGEGGKQEESGEEEPVNPPAEENPEQEEPENQEEESSEDPQEGSQQPIYGTVRVTTALNVRQGPGTHYVKVGMLSNNTRVQILEYGELWSRIRAGDIEGYVHMDYINLENTGDPNPQEIPDDKVEAPPMDTAPPPQKDKLGIVTASALNIRSGPSTKNHKVGMVVRGEKLWIKESLDGWYKIDYNGLAGYVSSDYVRIEDNDSQTPVAAEEKAIAKGIVTAGGLNVRVGSGTQYKKIGLLQYKQSVDLLGEENGWYKIRSGDLVGYVYGVYIEKLGIGKAIVTANALNVRTGAGIEHKRIGLIPKNTQVDVLEHDNGWYKVKNGSLTGYVSGEYLKMIS